MDLVFKNYTYTNVLPLPNYTQFYVNSFLHFTYLVTPTSPVLLEKYRKA